MKTKKDKKVISTASASEEVVEPPSAKLSVTRETLPTASDILEQETRISPDTRRFISTYFPATTIREWNNWKWQIKNSITTPDRLITFSPLSGSENNAFIQNPTLPFRITPYYLSLFSEKEENNPLRKTMIPTHHELEIHTGEETDPLDEEGDSVLPNLVHRYPDRVLFLVTNRCSAYCRYCTRTRMVSQRKNECTSLSRWNDALAYIQAHEEIRDVLISGGDPLTLSDRHLEYLLSRLKMIPHIEIIRIGTKVPMVLPMRITTHLTAMLKKYHPLYISIHITHPDEFTPESETALNRLADAGIVLGSQTVLLKAINDQPEIFMKLVHKMLLCRVRPYYLYQCDPVQGTQHFRTPVAKGLEIIHSLRGFTSGYAIPHYVIDAPNGGGKIPLLPDYVEGYDGDNLLLRNYQGHRFSYPDTAQ
ncbi:MAG: KamA family radical SAM protein [Bacteroidia bacterium]|nr:KamA family radical SAM protein [Bacteroidales bacterium]NCD41129.1 KamA family radical SAM protein [Bacteroidia bacterium]